MSRFSKLRPGTRSAREAEESGKDRLSLPLRTLPRRASLRPEIRAALALEEAGELQEAARVFEYAGEYAQAAALRLEHASTLKDDGERIAALREGCARNSGSTPEGRALYLALADTLVRRLENSPDSGLRRSLQIEAARVLEEADEGARAGELYESLGLLARAAHAYERAGEIARLELVLEVLERKEQAEAAIRALEQEAEQAWREGRRREARTLLLDHVRDRERLGRRPIPLLAQRLAQLEENMPRPNRIDISLRGVGITRVSGTRSFRIGRAPDVELTVADPALSRVHLELRLDSSGENVRLVAVDHGSRAGTFWDGEALVAGEPFGLEHPGRLGLGSHGEIDVHPLPGSHGPTGALVRADATAPWSLFVPGGGPLVLAPSLTVPARLDFDGDHVVLDVSTSATTWLHEEPLGLDARIELLVHDRVRIELDGSSTQTLEVIG